MQGVVTVRYSSRGDKRFGQRHVTEVLIEATALVHAQFTNNYVSRETPTRISLVL